MQNELTKIQAIVSAAHTAGWMECRDEIHIENDDELADFLIALYDEWDQGDKTQSWEEFSHDRIEKEYYPYK